jgi:VanZ family protein
MFFKYTRWSLLWALFILILCAIPGRDLPKVSVLELLNFDKFVHASLFFVLLLLTVRGFSLQTAITALHKSPKIMAFALCVIYGGTIELMQGAFFLERTADLNDFIANSFGCFIGIIIYDKIEKKVFAKI